MIYKTLLLATNETSRVRLVQQLCGRTLHFLHLFQRGKEFTFYNRNAFSEPEKLTYIFLWEAVAHIRTKIIGFYFLTELESVREEVIDANSDVKLFTTLALL